jgi:hypothetical protein
VADREVDGGLLTRVVVLGELLTMEGCWTESRAQGCVCVIVCVFPKGVIAAAHTALVISRELSHMLRLDTITIIITVTVRVN